MRTREQKSAGPMNMQPAQQLAISPSLPLMPTISRTSAIPTNRKRRKKKDDVQDRDSKKVSQTPITQKAAGGSELRINPISASDKGVADPNFSEVVVSFVASASAFVLLERTCIPTVQSA